jgi:hypothetical protein
VIFFAKKSLFKNFHRSGRFSVPTNLILRGIYAALCQAKVYIEERVNG